MPWIGPHEVNEWVTATTVKYYASGANKNLRYGQWMMNSLYADRPDLYVAVTGTQADPFYLDDNFEAFCKFLATRWLA